MILCGASAFKLLGSGSRTLRKCVAINSSVIGFTYTPIRPYSIASTPFRRKSTCLSKRFVDGNNVSPWRRAVYGQFRTARSSASSRIIRHFEDLPPNYRDEVGLPFRAKPISQREAEMIFGPGMDVGTANRALRIMHGRRVAGTLDDPAIPFGYEDRVQKYALSWLRKNIPIDEVDAAGKRAEVELQAIELEILADSKRLGLYKPNSGGTAQTGKESVYGTSGLESIIKERQLQSERKEKEKALAKKSQADEIRENTGPLALPNLRSRVELKSLGEHSKLQYYKERANVLPEVPPELSAWQRLWPSGLVTLLVIGLSAGWAYVYTPPETANRMWPDVPPAAATVISLIVMNCAVFVLWHHPPAFRMLNKYFILVPGYPRALAILGNTFSQQTVRHLAMNMVTLWFAGTQLHDDVGRANFLAIYLSSGVFASFTSLAVFTLKRRFMSSSLGASGSVLGVVAAYFWIHPFDRFKILGLPPDPIPGVPGLGILIPIILLELWGLKRAGKAGAAYDTYAHLGGLSAGVVGAEVWKRQMAGKTRVVPGRKGNIPREMRPSQKSQ